MVCEGRCLPRSCGRCGLGRIWRRLRFFVSFSILYLQYLQVTANPFWTHVIFDSTIDRMRGLRLANPTESGLGLGLSISLALKFESLGFWIATPPLRHVLPLYLTSVDEHEGPTLAHVAVARSCSGKAGFHDAIELPAEVPKFTLLRGDLDTSGNRHDGLISCTLP
jgi:hypothetical protein